MLKKSALIVSTALVLALPAGAAFAATDDTDDTATAVTCEQTQQRLQAHDGSGVANGGQAMVATQQRQRLQLDADCTGDGPVDGSGAGYGSNSGDCTGDGPIHDGSADGAGHQFGRAGR